MRCLDRNKRKFYYCLYSGETRAIDEDGNYTGEPISEYEDPVMVKGNVSAARGTAEIEQFGTNLSYDKTITLEGTDYPIDERTVLFVDSVPGEGGALGNPPYDYKVAEIAKSLNQTVIAISKVRENG
jgi:hypothetical protein